MPRGSSCWQADDEAGAGRGALRRAPVLGPDDAAMRLDDLLRYRQAEAGMGAEFLACRPLAVEAVEDGRELAFGDAGTVVLDGDDHGSLIALYGEGDGAAGRAEGNRVGDEVAEDLDQPVLDAGNDELRRPRTVRHDEAQAQRILRRGRIVQLDQGFQHAVERDRRMLVPAQLGIEARGVGDVADQAVEAMDILQD